MTTKNLVSFTCSKSCSNLWHSSESVSISACVDLVLCKLSANSKTLLGIFKLFSMTLFNATMFCWQLCFTSLIVDFLILLTFSSSSGLTFFSKWLKESMRSPTLFEMLSSMKRKSEEMNEKFVFSKTLNSYFLLWTPLVKTRKVESRILLW